MNLRQQYSSGEREEAHLRRGGPWLHLTKVNDCVHGQLHHRGNRRISGQNDAENKNTGRKPPYQGWQCMRKTMWENQDHISPVGGKYTLTEQSIRTRHTANNCIPHEKGENSYKDDWKKLLRVLRYLDATINSLKLYISMNNLNVVHWWVDASHGTHPYLKEHTGAKISIGKGCATSASKKQKS